MPASLLYEFEHSKLTGPLQGHHHHNNNSSGQGHLEDRRAFELALELSLLGLGADNNNNGCSNNLGPHSLMGGGTLEQQQANSMSSLGAALMGHQNMTSSLGNAHHQNSSVHPLNPFEAESRIGAKRSQNTTECVPVPSSEHVAEIVGRQGCKIKALRAKTNTYIKTPVRGEEPVFVVTGRKEDVGAAKREILSAAEHFSQIRAQRKNNPGAVGPAPNAHLPGHVTASVRVPYRVVGLVVGPKGATIKRIQQQTNTYIITPSREKDPVFEVTGLPEDVDTARKEIEAHIAIRTGGVIGEGGSGSGSVGTPEESSGSDSFSNSSPSLLLSSLEALNPFASTHQSLFSGYGKSNSSSSSDPFGVQNGVSSSGAFSFGSAGSSLLSNSPTDSVFVSGGQIQPVNHHQMSGPGTKFTDLYSLFSNDKANGSPCSAYDTDEGLGDSPTYGSGGGIILPHHGTWSDFSTSSGPQGRSNYVFSTMASNSTAAEELHRRSSSLESNSINSSSSSNAAINL